MEIGGQKVRNMSTDWGSAPFNAFLPETHHSPPESLDPAKVKLPQPFSVCIVGASRGIGAGIATSYAAAGASTIFLCSRRESGLQTVAEQCKTINPACQTVIKPTDITSTASVRELSELIRDDFGGKLDVVVVNSGYSGPVVLKVTDTDPESFRQASEVNYIGTFLCAKFLIPFLATAPPTGGDGGPGKAFIAVSTYGCFIVRGPIANTQYAVSKAAQLKLVEHLHEQFSAEEDGGVRVFAVHPGAVASEMALDTAPQEFMPYLVDSADLCGASCVWLTKDGNKSWLSGRLISALWDVDELEAKKTEVVEKDLLKLQPVCSR